MKGKKRRWLSVLLAVFLCLLASCEKKPPAESGGQPVSESAALQTGTSGKGRFLPVTMPKDTVKTLESYGMTENDFIRHARNNATYLGNQGYETPSVFVSPMYSLTVNGLTVPVYCTLTYVGGEYGDGAIHSFAMIDVADEDFSLEVAVTAQKGGVTNAVVLPESLGIKPALADSQTITASLTALGSYTFLTNEHNESVSQFTAMTIFVRRYTDEEEEIRAYQEQYGEDHVLVYKAGTHEISPIDMDKDNMVLYLCRGAYLIPQHNEAYTEENMQLSEPGIESKNSLGLKRWPAINVYQRDNIKILGRGVLDMGRLDGSERQTIAISNSSRIEIDGIMCINPPTWNIVTYRTEDIQVRNVITFGYRTTSDAVCIANSQNAEIADCYARSGDDLFEVKALGASDDSAVTENVTFRSCIAWAGKARCFGLTHETNKNVSRITYSDCAVLFCDSTWDNSSMGALVVVIGEGRGNVADITFENMEIYQCMGRPFLVAVNKQGTPRNTISSVVFRNITYTGEMTSLFHTQPEGENRVEAYLENVVANGTKVDENNLSSYVTLEGASSFCTICS